MAWLPMQLNTKHRSTKYGNNDISIYVYQKFVILFVDSIRFIVN